MACEVRWGSDGLLQFLRISLALWPDEKIVAFGSYFDVSVQKPNDCDFAIVHNGPIERTEEIRKNIELHRKDWEASVGVPLHVMILRGSEERSLTELLKKVRQ